MTRILLDANVILDILLERKPFAHAGASVWETIETRLAQGFVAAHAVTTIYYLARKAQGSSYAEEAVVSILQIFDVAPIDRSVLDHAVQLDFPDFEDAVTAAAASRAQCDFIVTRNAKDFRKSPVRCLTPEAMLPILAKP